MTRGDNQATPTVRVIEEHDLVRTREPLSDGAVVVPAGTVGTIVFVHLKDSAFEVEFSPQYEAVLSVYRRQIETL